MNNIIKKVAIDNQFQYSRWDNITSQWIAYNNSIVDVKDFGAIGDGIVDDSIAILDALNFIISKGYGTLFFPVGTYLTDSIEIHSNVKIRILGETLPNHLLVDQVIDKSVLVHKHSLKRPLIKVKENSVKAEKSITFSLENICLFSGNLTTHLIHIEDVTHGLEIKNVSGNVIDANKNCNGLLLFDCWRFIIDNLYLKCSLSSNGIGFKASNLLADKKGGAINQGIINNIHIRKFGIGIMIGELKDSHNVSSLIFNSGAIEFAERKGLYIASGVESIKFIGMHIENTGEISDEINPVQIHISANARNVSFSDTMISNRKPKAKNLEILIDGQAQNIHFDNIYFHRIFNGIKVLNSIENRNITVNNISFSCFENAGYGIVNYSLFPIYCKVINWNASKFSFNTKFIGPISFDGQNAIVHIMENFKIQENVNNITFLTVNASVPISITLPSSLNIATYKFITKNNLKLTIMGENFIIHSMDNLIENIIEISSFGEGWFVSNYSGNWKNK